MAIRSTRPATAWNWMNAAWSPQYPLFEAIGVSSSTLVPS